MVHLILLTLTGFLRLAVGKAITQHALSSGQTTITHIRCRSLCPEQHSSVVTATVTIYTGSLSKRTARDLPFADNHYPDGRLIDAWSQPRANPAPPDWQTPVEHDGSSTEQDIVRRVLPAAMTTSTTRFVTKTASVTTNEIHLTTHSITVSSNADTFNTITKTVTADKAVCPTAATSTATVTRDIKCAATSLISSVGRFGIGQIQSQAEEVRLVGEQDPSTCCQSCLDTEGCAAMAHDSDAANCFLYFTWPTCGLAFRYSPWGGQVAPGAGMVVQAGCGDIGPV